MLGFALPILAIAGAEPIIVAFDGKAPREIWIADNLPKAAPAASVKSDDEKITLTPSKVDPGDKVFVWDKATGLLAAKSIEGANVVDGPHAGTKAKLLEFKPDAFDRVFRTTVRVEHAGKPVAAASVSVNDSERTETELLTPADKGEADFYALKMGPVKVEVQVKTEAGAKKLPVQTFDLDRDTLEPTPKLTIATSEAVETIEPEKAKEDDEKVAGEKTSPLGGALVMLLGLAVAIGVVWAFLRLYKSNPKVVEDNLKKLGVELPDPNAPVDDDSATPVGPPGPQPVEPILLDAAVADPVASAPISVGPSTLALVDESGRRLVLVEGASRVGREAGLEVALVGESTVSRAHATIQRDGASLVVQDLGSTNGTFVNGVRIDAPTAVRPGDTVQFGTVRFRVEA